MDTTTGELDDMKTLTSCMRKLDKLGFDTQFQVTNMGIKSFDTEKLFAPHQVKIVNFYRFEGASNPDDSAILYAIETEDGERGTLTDSYGAFGEQRIADFIKEVEMISKKVDKEQSLKDFTNNG